jgi:hypothetical protein
MLRQVRRGINVVRNHHINAAAKQRLGNHLLFYLAQDFLQSAISIVSLSMEGLISVAKRELRFILESAIKLCFVQRKNYGSTVEAKLTQFDKELSSQRISIKDNLKLHMLPEDLRPAFIEEVGRLYGFTSGYVHLTPAQIQERIAAVDAGRTAGKESAADIADLNALLLRNLAASLVLILHSVPDYVAGDWFVEADGTTVKWRFMCSRFLSGMDSYFDYKHERQERLAEIAAARAVNIKF